MFIICKCTGTVSDRTIPSNRRKTPLLKVPGFSLDNNGAREKAAVTLLITLCDKNQRLFRENLIQFVEQKYHLMSYATCICWYLVDEMKNFGIIHHCESDNCFKE